MSKSNVIFVLLFVAMLLFSCSPGLYHKIKTNENQDAYKELYSQLQLTTPDKEYYVVFYVEINSNLTCGVSVEPWKKLELETINSKGSFHLLTNKSDSLDVAIAMSLEGFYSKVQVVDDRLINALKWNQMNSPVLVKLNSNDWE